MGTLLLCYWKVHLPLMFQLLDFTSDAQRLQTALADLLPQGNIQSFDMSTLMATLYTPHCALYVVFGHHQCPNTQASKCNANQQAHHPPDLILQPVAITYDNPVLTAIWIDVIPGWRSNVVPTLANTLAWDSLRQHPNVLLPTLFCL